MFAINTRTAQEALNYATLLNALECSEHTLEPKFNQFSVSVDVGIPLNDNSVINEYSEFFGVSKERLGLEYGLARGAFLDLRPTDEIVRRDSMHYPVLLKKIEHSPRFLYIRGRKSLMYEKKTVAVVGSRNASEEAKENTKSMVDQLGECSLTIVSGLARGIDVTAHKEALRQQYHTIAVIGTNLNQYYPAENRNIQKAIEEYGAVVSPFSPAAATQKWFFPFRNGVMSGMTLATIIMEAGETSGALKQADYAFKQGRQVIFPKSALTSESILWLRKYIRKGAFVVENLPDILKVLANGTLRDECQKPAQMTLDQYVADIKGLAYQNLDSAWLPCL